MACSIKSAVRAGIASIRFVRDECLFGVHGSGVAAVVFAAADPAVDLTGSSNTKCGLR